MNENNNNNNNEMIETDEINENMNNDDIMKMIINSENKFS